MLMIGQLCVSHLTTSCFDAKHAVKFSRAFCPCSYYNLILLQCAETDPLFQELPADYAHTRLVVYSQRVLCGCWRAARAAGATAAGRLSKPAAR